MKLSDSEEGDDKVLVSLTNFESLSEEEKEILQGAGESKVVVKIYLVVGSSVKFKFQGNNFLVLQTKPKIYGSLGSKEKKEEDLIHGVTENCGKDLKL